MQYLFSLTLSEMGISPLLLVIIISFSLLFIVAFGLSSKNMDSDGIMDWMMKKPEDWIGNKNHNASNKWKEAIFSFYKHTKSL